MQASRTPDDRVVLTMSDAEAVVLHGVLASAEFADDLQTVDLPEAEDRKVASDVQQALAPLVPGLGTDRYARTLRAAYAAIDPAPY